ncbi:MAG TPA: ferritin-like domain-containing protein, partial [Rummeliibacillus sp.]|nr:ferritin-like domain-containing protein [Rummeliibacillus sp.]
MNDYMFDGQMQCSVLNDLKKAMDGEHDAICYYEVLANLAPNPKIKKQILEIREDEIRHYQ